MARISMKMTRQGRRNLKRGFADLRAELVNAGIAIGQEVGEIYVERVTDMMGVLNQGGPYHWKPLSEKWLTIKQTNQWRQEIWQATGETRRATQVAPSQVSGSEVTTFAGIRGPVTGPGYDAAPITRAIQTEFGLQGDPRLNFPPRPLFKPEALKIAEELKELQGGVARGKAARAVRRLILIATRRAEHA